MPIKLPRKYARRRRQSPSGTRAWGILERRSEKISAEILEDGCIVEDAQQPLARGEAASYRRCLLPSELTPMVSTLRVKEAGKVFTAFLAIAVPTASGTWLLSRTNLADELEQYRQADKWKIADAIREMTPLLEKLNATLAEGARIDAERAELARLREENRSLSEKAAASEKLARELEARLVAYEGDRFVVKEGSSRVVIPGELAIGVVRVSDVSSTCFVQLGPKSAGLDPGESMEEIRAGKRVILTFMERETGARACVFTLGVRPAER